MYRTCTLSLSPPSLPPPPLLSLLPLSLLLPSLTRFANRGRLVGHNGAVCALALSGPLILTGSRDRLIKMYEMDALQGQPDSSPSPPTTCPSHVSLMYIYSRLVPVWAFMG